MVVRSLPINTCEECTIILRLLNHCQGTLANPVQLHVMKKMVRVKLCPWEDERFKENNFYSGLFCNFAFSASMTAEKSSSLRPRDLATLYSSLAAAAIGVGWETDSANPRASRKSCHVQFALK